MTHLQSHLQTAYQQALKTVKALWWGAGQGGHMHLFPVEQDLQLATINNENNFFQEQSTLIKHPVTELGVCDL